MQGKQQYSPTPLTERFALTNGERDQRVSYIALTPRDIALLQELLPWMQEHVDEIVEEFYAHLLQFKEARAFFPDEATLRHVKAAQRDYLLDLCRGRFDEEYFERRLRIGVTHERTGVAPKWFIGSYANFSRLIFPLIAKLHPLRPEHSLDTMLALLKIMNLDQQLVMKTYIVERVTEVGRERADLQLQLSHSQRMEAELDRERHNLQLQLAQAQKMEAIGRLAGGVAHDFNNHLGVIIGYSDLLLDRLPPDDPLHRSASMIKEAGQRGASLTRQLLAFSRRQVFEPTVLDLNAVIREMDKMLRPLLGEDIELVSLLDPALGTLRADPAQIDQIIMNLAVNARDAMPRGGRLILQTANAELDDVYADMHITVNPGQYVMLTVTDNGMGMDRHTQEKMFEPFFTTKEKGHGTGLGLSTVYGIVKQSGGTIWAYSELGQGTTFKIYLPRVDEPVAALSAAPDPRPQSMGEETVLVVEDEGVLRELACEFLRKSGYTVLSAGNGAEALEVSNRHQETIHLLISDAVMPGISGSELAQHFKLQRPDAKVLFVSGYTDDSVLRNGLLEPGTAFLQKPFTRGALTRKVRAVLDGE